MAALESEIIIVSGLPRSGTSLMMQMLDSGGVETVTDRIRSADSDNPRGYYELEQVKSIKRDASWLPSCRGKAVKMISQLLYDLPSSEHYRIIFMERDLGEVLISQEKMLQRLNRPAALQGELRNSYWLHLQRLRGWLDSKTNLRVLNVNYNRLLAEPYGQSRRVSEFLDELPNPEQMVAAIDISLYRNRLSASK